jgi:hypothetical protein
MATLAILRSDETLQSYWAQYLYTLARILKNPHTQPFVADFQALGPILKDALKTESELDDTDVLLAAARDAADDVLDPIMLQIVATLLLLTGDDREDPLVVSYTAGATGAEIVRAVLGPELVMAEEWVGDLAKETEPRLLAYAAPLADAVTVGKAAEGDIKVHDKARSTFRLTGQRQTALDALNAGRAKLFGLLLAFRHDHPELRLPTDWAMRFFRHETKAPKFGATVAKAEQYLADLEEEKLAVLAHIEALKQKDAAREKAKADRAQARIALAEARKAKREQNKLEKKLEAEANKPLK